MSKGRGAHREHAKDDRGVVFGFVARLLAGWAVVTVVLALVPSIEGAMVAGTVSSVAGALRLLGVGNVVTGDTITAGTAGLRIIPECTPLLPFVLFGVAVLAYPGAFRWKLIGLGVGAVTLWAFNIVRMLALLVTLVRWPNAFRFVHVYLWQTVTLLAVAAMFLLWLRLTPGRSAPAPAAERHA